MLRVNFSMNLCHRLFFCHCLSLRLKVEPTLGRAQNSSNFSFTISSWQSRTRLLLMSLRSTLALTHRRQLPWTRTILLAKNQNSHSNTAQKTLKKVYKRKLKDLVQLNSKTSRTKWKAGKQLWIWYHIKLWTIQKILKNNKLDCILVQLIPKKQAIFFLKKKAKPQASKKKTRLKSKWCQVANIFTKVLTSRR